MYDNIYMFTNFYNGLDRIVFANDFLPKRLSRTKARYQHKMHGKPQKKRK